jgi:hypothetical protein
MKFDIDSQRGFACLVGLGGLILELVLFYLTGKEAPQILTGAFLTLAVGPVLTSIIERYKDNRQDPPEDGPSGSETDPPQSDSENPNLRLLVAS